MPRIHLGAEIVHKKIIQVGSVSYTCCHLKQC